MKRETVILFCLFMALLQGCVSSGKSMLKEEGATMEQVYDRFTGVNAEKLSTRKQDLLSRPAGSDCDLQLGLPPYPEQLDHLYPRLPNPDLFMWVRPHAVGASGSPIPAYITRFSMYERQPYALPGETLDTVRPPTTRVPTCRSTENREHGGLQ